MNNKIKILFISHSPFYNGAEICLFNLVKNIDKDLFTPVVVFPYIGPLLKDIEDLGIKTYIIPVERWIRYKFEKQIRYSKLKSRSQKIENVIEEESIDIVHTNSSVVLEGAIASMKKNIPHIWHIHEYLQGHPELNPCFPLPFIYRIISEFSDKIVCVSNFTKGQFKNFISDDKLVTIYNGVDKNIIDNDFSFEKLGIIKDGLIAVTVGMLTERKGYPLLVDAAALVFKKGYKIKFLWVGGSSKKTLQNFRSRIRKLGLKDKVIYLGFSKDISNILKHSDVYVCSSMNEAFPLVVLEAMSAGLPVISTNWGGASECIIEGETGSIIPINDSDKLSEKIIDLCQDKQKRNNFGSNGLKYFTENFNVKVYAENFSKLYSDIIHIKRNDVKSSKENVFLDSFMEVYDIVSDYHWRVLKKKK